MKFRVLCSALVLGLALSSQASAGTIFFNNTEVPTINNGDTVTNQWNSYGVGVQNAYWYVDSRDPFDQQGLSILQDGVARINLLNGTTNSITVDWWTIQGTETIRAFNSADVQLDVFSGAGSGTQTLNGTNIAYITWEREGGFEQISTLTCDICGGEGTVKTPEPMSMILLGSGLMGLALRQRRKRK